MNGGPPTSERDPVRRLSEAVLAVNQHLETPDVLATIVRIARQLLGAEYAALGVPDGAGSFAQFVVDGVPDEQWERIGPLPRQHGMLAVMLHDPAPQRLTNISADPRFGWWPDAHPELTAFLGMPITHGDEIIGAIFLANKDGGFDDSDEELLATLAAHAAIALTNASLYERSRELTIARERTRLAHDLHDAVSQKLFGLRLTAQAAAALVERDPGRAREELAEVEALAREASEELQAAVTELRPAALEDDGLVTTLRKQVLVLDRAIRAQDAECPTVRFRDSSPPALAPAQQQVVLRVAQEAMHNAVRHAAACTIEVSIGPAASGGAELRVTDDGAGFDPDALRSRGGNLGLRSMRARAASVRGRMAVDSAVGRGTMIRLEVPRDRPA